MKAWHGAPEANWAAAPVRWWVAAGHREASSHKTDFKKIVIIKNPSSQSPAIA